jgi:two-component system CAI-1 autoinducer sensor kinase/phosphatase CqsS
VLQQLPIHWFTIAVLSAAKISRQVLAQEKLAGMGAGLATVAHELRTPLTSVDANVRGLLRRGRHQTRTTASPSSTRWRASSSRCAI